MVWLYKYDCCLNLTKSEAFVQSNIQKFIHTFIHWWLWLPRKVPTSNIRSSSTCRPGGSNQWPSNNKMLTLPLIHSPPPENTEKKKIICDQYNIMLCMGYKPKSPEWESCAQSTQPQQLTAKSCHFHFFPRRHVGPGAALIMALWDQDWHGGTRLFIHTVASNRGNCKPISSTCFEEERPATTPSLWRCNCLLLELQYRQRRRSLTPTHTPIHLFSDTGFGTLFTSDLVAGAQMWLLLAPARRLSLLISWRRTMAGSPSQSDPSLGCFSPLTYHIDEN